MTTHTLDEPGIGPVDITFTDDGEGRPFLFLHGGGGPDTVAGFAARFATRRGVRTLTPIHPGFGGTPRPAGLTTVRDLAAVYVALLDDLDLTDVTVVGNSIGGWIAAEVGLLGSPRVGQIVLVNAVGIVVPGHPIADFFSLTMDQVSQLSFHDPEPFRIDPTTLPPAAQQVAAANRATLAVYSGAGMSDPGLAGRLAAMTTPTLVLWGESDRIVDVDYGRAFAKAIPTATFEVLENTGHMPQIETPDALLQAI